MILAMDLLGEIFSEDLLICSLTSEGYQCQDIVFLYLCIQRVNRGVIIEAMPSYICEFVTFLIIGTTYILSTYRDKLSYKVFIYITI